MPVTDYDRFLAENAISQPMVTDIDEAYLAGRITYAERGRRYDDVVTYAYHAVYDRFTREHPDYIFI